MSAAITNVKNTDVVDLTMEQSSSPRTEIWMEEPLLDATKDYVVTCSELACPLSEEPMLTYDIIEKDLFTIRKRKIGQKPNSDDDTVPSTYAPTFSLNKIMPIYSPADFLAQLANWASTFSEKCFVLGLPAGQFTDTITARFDESGEPLDSNPRSNHSMLVAAISPSGVIQLKGSLIFWRNFYITANPYAQQLVGVPHSEILFTIVDGNATPDPKLLVAGDGNIVTSDIPKAQNTIAAVGEYSVFRFMEERMYLTLEAGDLSVPFNALIRDGKESKTFALATYPFETNYKTTIKTQNGKIISSTEIEMDTHIARTHFQSKTEPAFSWFPLESSYMVQNMRLELFITRRRYTAAKGWFYNKTPLKIHTDGVWSCSLKFISVH